MGSCTKLLFSVKMALLIFNICHIGKNKIFENFFNLLKISGIYKWLKNLVRLAFLLFNFLRKIYKRIENSEVIFNH